MAGNQKQLGTQRLGLTELGKDVEKANEQLKSLGTGVNLDMSDVMTKEIKRQLDQLVKAAKNSGNETKNDAVQLTSSLQKVSKETISYANNTANAVKIVRQGYDKLGRTITETTKNGILTNKKIITSDETDDIKRMTSAVSALSVAYKNLSAAKKNKDYVGQSYWSAQVETQKQIVNSIKKEVTTKGLSSKAQGQINDQLLKAQNAERVFNGEVAKTQTGFDKLLSSVKSFVVQMVVMRGLSALWTNATSYAKEYYDALNEIRMVTGMSKDEAQDLGQEYIQLAKEMSVSSTEIATAAVEYYRQGQTGDAVTDNLEWTIKYAKVAGLEFAEAAEIMTAAMNSMDLSAQKVTDVFSYLGDASAAGADEIGIAMQKAAASAQEAGISFEWLGAYIATVSEKTRQAPEVVGSAFNTMMARLHNIKATGFDEEDGTRINDIAKALATLPEPLTLINSLTGEWVDMSDIFAGIAEQWDTLSDKQRAYISTTMAGTRQQNMFLTLMGDMAKAGNNASRAYELYAGAIVAAGSATDKYKIYQESVTASIDGMKASWEAFVNIFNGGEAFAKFYDAVSLMIDVLTEGTESMNGLNLGVIAVGGMQGFLIPLIGKVVAAIKTLPAAIKAVDITTSTSKIGQIVTAISAVIGVITTLVGGIGKVNEAQKKIDYDSIISKTQTNVTELGSLIDKYEMLASKVGLTDTEYQEMQTTLNGIKQLVPGYADALTSSQEDIAASIALANEALVKQKKLLQENIAAKALQELNDVDNQREWDTSFDRYFQFGTALKSLQNASFVNAMGETIDIDPKWYDSFKSYKEAVQTFAQDGAFHFGSGGDWDTLKGITGYGDDYLFTMLKNGQQDSIYSSQESAANDSIAQMVSHISNSLQSIPEYVDLSNVEKKYVSSKIDQELGDLKHSSIDALNVSEFISYIYEEVGNYISEASSDSSIDNNAIEEMLYSALQPTGYEDNYIDEIVINTMDSIIEEGQNSDQVTTAQENMKKAFAGKFSWILSDALAFENSREGLISSWQDTLLGLEHIIQATLESEDLVPEGWASELTSQQLLMDYSKEEIQSSYQKFLDFWSKGLVTDEYLTKMLESNNLANEYESIMGQLNGVIAVQEELETAAQETENAWSKYIKSAAVGGEEYIDNLQEISEKMLKIAQLRSDLKIMEAGGDGSTEAASRLNAEFGTTNPQLLNKFISTMEASFVAGLAYQGESVEAGASVLTEDLKTMYGEAAYVITNAMHTSLVDAARMSEDGAAFLAEGFADKLISDLSNTSDVTESAAAVRAVTLALEDGIVTWEELSSVVKEGATAADLFALAYKDIPEIADPTAVETKWNDYVASLENGDISSKIATEKEIMDEMTGQADSISDFYLAVWNGDSSAYDRLFKKYGTISKSRIDTYIAAEKDELRKGAEILSQAGYGLLDSYFMDEEFFSPSVLQEKLKDTITMKYPGSGFEGEGFDQIYSDLESDAESVEQLTAALWLLDDALNSGYVSLEQLNEAMNFGLTMEEVMSLFNEAAIREQMDQIREFSKMSSSEDKYSFMQSLFGKEGNEQDTVKLDALVEGLRRLRSEGDEAGDALRKALNLDEDVWKDIEDGGETAEDSLKAIQKQVQKLKLKKMEEAGEIMEGMSEAFELAEEGGSDYHDKVIELQKTMTSLADAQDAYNVVSDTSLKGTEQYTNALSTLGSYVNMDSELLESNLSLALNKINADASFAQASLAELVWAQYAVSGSYFDPSTWTSGLIALSNGASSTTQNLATMINTMLMAAGARIQATLNANGTAASINVTGLGTGKTFAPPSATGSKGGGGGGGGGGGSNASSEEDKMLSHMNHLIDIIARKLEALDSIMSQYETEGYITGLINGLEMENELLEEQNALYQDNLSTIDDKLASLYAKLATTKKGSKEYDKLLGQIETLEDAYNEFTLSMLDNESAIIANEKAIKDYYDEIRDMEIDLRETILDAIEDRVSREEDALDARIDMEEEVLDAIIKRHEKERDQILETTEMQIEALEKEKDALDEALDARKRAAEEEDKQLQLKKLEAQQTRISADPTRAKEALEIQKQIADLRDEIAWDEAEKEVEAQKDSIDQQITSLEDYAEYIEKYYSNLLDNPRNFLDEVNKILSSSHEQIVEWLKQYSEDYSKSTDSAQKSLEDNWNEILNTMNGITITHWEEVEKIISQGDEAIIKFLKENSQDYREAGKLQAEAYVDEWTKKLQDLHKAYLDMKPELPNFKETDTTSTSASKGGSGGGGGGSSNAEKLWYIMNGTNKLYSKGFKTADEAEDYRAKQQQYWENSFTGAQMSHAGNETLATYSANVGKWKNAKIMEQFKLGGLASFTGPAWLDGSLTAPERVLSPYQTKLFENMVAALQKVATVNVPSLPFIASPEHGSSGNFSFGDIVINVDKLESDADYEEMAKKVGEVLLRQMNKGSYVGGIRYSF